MRLSTSSSIYFRRPSGKLASVTDAVRLCAQAGFRVMEINFQDCTEARSAFTGSRYQAWLEHIAACAQEHGVTFGQAHAPVYNICDDGFGDRERLDKLVRRSLRCAAYLDIPWVVVHAGTDFGAANWLQASVEKNMRYLLPLVDLAEELGVGIAIENQWDWDIAPQRRFTAQAEEVMKLVELLGSDRVGICCDVEHAVIMGQDAGDMLRLMGPRLKATHISDVMGIGSDRVLPFQGKGNWYSVMSALRDVNYTGDLTLDIRRTTAGLPDELIPAALSYSVAVGEYLLSL